ncbi:MAG TPA: DUF504 domain-containing protein [Nitrososphaeraceae archaeon]|jgi:hypothetical protein|nr:DUF504 domain-containing protein [Nitrososphaeraceae archaeon]
MVRKKKGKLEEILSKALYADNPAVYIILYRDFNTLISIPLLEFIDISHNFEIIPANRIVQIIKKDKIIYQKRIHEFTNKK